MNDLNRNSAPCILLVNHSTTFLTLARQFLKGTNPQIVEAHNCEAALEACRIHSPKLIYLAASLPEPGGVECCRRIKNDPEFSQIPVVLLAREKDGDHTTLSRLSNCDAVIGIPLDQKNFLAIGRSFLAGFREHRHQCQLPARLILQDQQDNCQGLDISRSGAFLAHRNPPSLGRAIQVELQLTHTGDSGPRITCDGQVAWVNAEEKPIKPTHPPGFGVRFTDLSARDAAVLNGFIRTIGSSRPDAPAPLYS